MLRACGSLLRPAGGQELPWARAFAAIVAPSGGTSASTSASTTTVLSTEQAAVKEKPRR
jgi:hypothetical protein